MALRASLATSVGRNPDEAASKTPPPIGILKNPGESMPWSSRASDSQHEQIFMIYNKYEEIIKKYNILCN
jgi:hypothetical protein